MFCRKPQSSGSQLDATTDSRDNSSLCKRTANTQISVSDGIQRALGSLKDLILNNYNRSLLFNRVSV